MSKVPRDLSGEELARLLGKYEYRIIRQKGSHIRLVSTLKGSEHKITIPSHSSIKIGTLHNILSDVAEYLKIPKQHLINELFNK